jgi:hypothetical protein
MLRSELSYLAQLWLHGADSPLLSLIFPKPVTYSMASPVHQQKLREPCMTALLMVNVRGHLKKESITKLAMLMTRNSEAARAARLASEDSGELTKGETNSAGKGIGLILFDNAKEGAKAFLDKAQGNHFTA